MFDHFSTLYMRVSCYEYHHDTIITSCERMQRRIHNSEKHLRWSVNGLWSLIIFAKRSILDAWQGSECLWDEKGEKTRNFGVGFLKTVRLRDSLMMMRRTGLYDLPDTSNINYANYFQWKQSGSGI